LRLLRTGRFGRQQLGWFAVLVWPLACSIYDEGLDPRDSGAKDVVSDARGRRDVLVGSGGSGASDASGPGGETEGGVEDDGERSTPVDGAVRAAAAENRRATLPSMAFDDAGPDGEVVSADADGAPDVPVTGSSMVAGLPISSAMAQAANGRRRRRCTAHRRGRARCRRGAGDTSTPDDADADANDGGGPIVGVVYNIIAQHSGRCLTVLGNLPFDGTNIVQFACDNSASQRFRLQAASASSYVIFHIATNKCTDVDNSGTADGTNVALWTCNNTVAQIYAFKETASAGFYTIVNPNSGKCLDVEEAGMGDLANVQIYTCNGATNQAWEFVRQP
jgi:hypothetical protein